MTEIFGEVRRGPTRWGLQHIRRKDTGSVDYAFRLSPEPDIARISISSRGKTANKTASIRTISNEQANSKLSLAATSAVIVATSLATGNLYAFASGQGVRVGDLCASGLLIALFFCSILRLSEEHQPLKTSHIFGRARAALLSWLTSFALFLAIAFAFKIGAEFSRGAVLSFFFAGFVTATAAHIHVPIILARLQRPGAFSRRDVILVGAYGDPTVQRVLDEFQRNGGAQPHVVEFEASCSNREWPRERKALLDRTIKLAHRLGPGEIYLATSQILPARAESILRVLSLVPRAVMVIPDAFTAHLLRHASSEVGSEIAVGVQSEPMTGLGRVIKRANDVVLSCLAIAFLAPLLVAIAAAVKWDSAGPILFRQTRNGYQGRTFRILKFRTMTVMEDGDIVTQARKDDVRTTRLGHWLRKTSLDELPQLFNVLRGEMSLIGPRPHARAHDIFYAKVIDNYEIRQHVKPGITGWAQVNGLRGETQTLDLMYRRIEFDLWYARNCSIFLDFRILARTVLEVVRPRNAY